MNKSRRLPGTWLLACLLTISCGCSKKDQERLAGVGRRAAAKAEVMMASSDSKLATGLRALRADLDEMALDARVSARLRWDKSLAGAQIHPSARGGIVELRGTVLNDGQRQRALELARSTVGAEQVNDALELPAAQP